MRARKLVRWGNGMAIRIPKALLEDAGVQEGDTLNLSVRNGSIVARPAKKKATLKELVAKVSPANLHGEVDWGKPKGKEIW